MSSKNCRNSKMMHTCAAAATTAAETSAESKGSNCLEGMNSFRSSSCHKNFFNLFQLVCVAFLVVHAFIQPTPTAAIRLQVHKVTDKSSPAKRGNFGWAARSSYDYPHLADQGVRQSSDFAGGRGPFSAWLLDNSRAGAAADYEAVGANVPADSTQGDMSPSVALYLSENLLSKYAAQKDKLEQQRKREAFMDRVYELH